MTLSGFPRPPFRTHGSALAIPCIVRSDSVSLPPDLAVVHTAGRTLGMLVYLEYHGPSRHRELLWVNALVRCRDRSYRVPDAVGPLYYVARIYTDRLEPSEADLSMWGSPPAAAVFGRQGNRIEVDGEDGTRVAFSFRPRGFTVTAPLNMGTLQKDRERILCFRAGGRAEVQLASFQLEELTAGHPSWESCQRGILLPGFASHVPTFEMRHRRPLTLERRLESMAPAPLMG